jgi:hypothetical protein
MLIYILYIYIYIYIFILCVFLTVLPTLSYSFDLPTVSYFFNGDTNTDDGSGSSVHESGGYMFYTFVGDGTFSMPVRTSATVLIVGGGGKFVVVARSSACTYLVCSWVGCILLGGGGQSFGGGSNEGNGGGGAGGVGQGTVYLEAGVTYRVVVGAGGSSASQGGDSRIKGGSVSEVAYGGGFGGSSCGMSNVACFSPICYLLFLCDESPLTDVIVWLNHANVVPVA